MVLLYLTAFMLVNGSPAKGTQAQYVGSEESISICAEIIYQRYVGVKKIVKADSRDLNSKRARELSDLIRKADFFNLPEVIVTPKYDGCCDRGFPDFRIIIQTNGKWHAVKINAQDVVPPERLKPLLKWLENRAEPTGRDMSTNEKCHSRPDQQGKQN